jgi:putative PIG3 family NAD(P)H quinone oxidoreductase
VTVLEGDRVEVADRPLPEPGEGDLLVRVHGAGLNRADLLQRAGLYPAPPDSPPDIPGLEFAGIVDRVGHGVTAFSAGDRVFGICGGGGQAEVLVVPAPQCTRVPDGLDLVAMGGVPEAFVTAHDALVTQAGLSAGECALVHAVGSGVGTAAVQLASALGAEVVGTARTSDKLERCRHLGLVHGVVPPTTEDGSLDVPRFVAALQAACGGADVTLDLVGGAYVEADVAVSAHGGWIVLVGTLAGGWARLDLLTAMQRRLTIKGTVLRARSIDEKGEAVDAFARDVVPLLARRAVEPVIERVLPLERAAEAYDLLASNATFGKVVLSAV